MLGRILQVSALVGLAFDAVAADERATAGKAEFVGGSPCDSLPREFLGGIASGAPCMWIGWRLALSSDRTYHLTAVYGIPTRQNPNVSEDGPKVERRGIFAVERGTAADPGAFVFRLLGSEPGRSVSFARIGEKLLHLLGPDKRLLAGNGGWSYTLNLAGADTLGADATPPAAARASAPPSGVFDGRTPCQPLARRLGAAVSGECFKMKWRLQLHVDKATGAPTTYVLEGSPYRATPRTGRWAIRGTVYQLDPESPKRSLAFLRADDDVLLFLDENGEPLVGNADFSYTLSRQR